MGKLNNFVLINLLMIIILGLVGCSSDSSDTNINNPDSPGGENAKKYIEDIFEEIVEEYALATNEDNLLSADEYYYFKDNINIISKSINSLAAIGMNSPEQFADQIELLRGDLDVISEETAEEAKVSMHSTELIYEATIMEEMGTLGERVRINGTQNLLSQFIDTDFDTTEEAIISAEDFIEEMNASGTGDYAYLEYVNSRINNIKKMVSDDGFKRLETINGLFESSLHKQQNMLKSFVDPSSDVNVDEEFESAVSDYEEAENLLDEFEGQ